LFCQRRSLFKSGTRILDSSIRLGLRSSNLSRGVGDFFFLQNRWPMQRARLLIYQRRSIFA
jgi:hypothetical protein